MSAPAWMPLYVADYLADTGHLSTVEHGAYILLIMHYWQNGGLPLEDAKLARICRLSPKEWASIRDTIADLFAEGWRHKRVEEELSTAVDVIGKKSAAGRAGGLASAARRRQQANSKRPTTVGENANDRSTSATANVNTSPKQTPTSPLRSEVNSVPNGTAPADLEKQLFDRGKAVLGKDAGGLISKVLKAKNGDVALARAAIETASTKQSPREYLGAIARGAGPPGEGIVKVGL